MFVFLFLCVPCQTVNLQLISTLISADVVNLKFSFALKQLKGQSLEFKQVFYSSFRSPNFVLNFFELFKLKTSDPV